MSESKPPMLGAAVGEGVVILEVGLERTKYYVHSALLTHHSEYFRNALGGPWLEAETGVFKWNDIHPAVVNLFVHWLYTNTLPESDEWEETRRMLGPTSQACFLAKLKAYAFADRFLVPEFRRAVNNSLVDDIQEWKWMIPLSEMSGLAQEAFANIPSDRPILQFLVDKAGFGAAECYEAFGGSMDDLPRAFLQRLIRRLDEELRRERAHENESKSRCYYEHASKKEQEACRDLHMEYDEEKDFGFFGKPYLLNASV
ncbi:Nn.00g064050.m01.CDS01 [Neocucurbitaria sp. VM-36]